MKRGKVEARGKWAGGMAGSKSHAKRHSFFSCCELSGNVSLIKCDMDSGGTGLAVHAMAGLRNMPRKATYTECARLASHPPIKITHLHSWIIYRTPVMYSYRLRSEKVVSSRAKCCLTSTTKHQQRFQATSKAVADRCPTVPYGVLGGWQTRTLMIYTKIK